MKLEFGKHTLAYLILLIGIGAFLLYFFAVWPNRAQQRLLSAVFVLFYFFWGLSTHVKTSRLNGRVVLEYFAASLFVGILLFLVTL
jgi:hypothetical protein